MRQALNAKLGKKFEQAFLYACEAHRTQTRKNSHTAFIAHPIAVASLLIECDFEEDVIVAALLHDVVEDQGGKLRLDDIRNIFGQYVAELVAVCSDSMRNIGEEKEDWDKRKKRYYEQLDFGPIEALQISCADKIHNLRSIVSDYDISGDVIWSSFSASPDEMWRYYRRLQTLYAQRGVHPRLQAALNFALKQVEKRIHTR